LKREKKATFFLFSKITDFKNLPTLSEINNLSNTWWCERSVCLSFSLSVNIARSSGRREKLQREREREKEELLFSCFLKRLCWCCEESLQQEKKFTTQNKKKSNTPPKSEKSF
jgi:hypothetical protein